MISLPAYRIVQKPFAGKVFCPFNPHINLPGGDWMEYVAFILLIHVYVIGGILVFVGYKGFRAKSHDVIKMATLALLAAVMLQLSKML
jgi:hypothetical protein